ncbi:hypothetical protein [Vallicoccus soli]|uniref:Uncharacterized protein n=1 Tax=Vallicoccus soli TaxID=2339232 RepID=A0A3A3Z1I2_9ACTN|nr:hypothetical protein [Vallicoccus soli]RJK96452.1 hypothetical protein D5H78_09540 [Vallicoccus soli]
MERRRRALSLRVLGPLLAGALLIVLGASVVDGAPGSVMLGGGAGLAVEALVYLWRGRSLFDDAGGR